MKALWATKVIPVLLTSAALSASVTGAAKAQPFPFTYVSEAGNNSNLCGGPSPSTACRTFAGAQNKTTDGGTITCVDVGFFGAFTITKSLTVDCHAGGGAFNAEAIFIDAPGKNVKVRNIALNGVGVPTIMDIVSADSVHLENLLVNGSTSVAIYDRRTGPAKLFISDSSIVANAGNGIVVAPSGGTVIGAVLDNVRVRDNVHGIGVGSGGRVIIKRSVSSGNSVSGVIADPGAVVGISETLISFNGNGILASSGSTVSISNSDIDSNTTAISGATRSFGNNRFFVNVNDGTTPTPVGAPSSENGLR